MTDKELLLAVLISPLAYRGRKTNGTTFTAIEINDELLNEIREAAL